MKKLMQLVLLYGLLALLPSMGFSQIPVCGFDAIFKSKMKDPEYTRQFNQFNQAVQAKVQQIKMDRALYKNANIVGGIYELPVVVHVLVPNGEAIGHQNNPSDASIQAMIDHFNDVYSGVSPYNVGAPIPIRLKLAKRTTGCGVATAINRVDASSVPQYKTAGLALNQDTTGASEATLQGLASAWDRSLYYNIWIVWQINAKGLASNTYIAGYAYLPGMSGNGFTGNIGSNDGAMLNAKVVNGTASTLAHELAHAMGLLHTFQGGSETNCPPAETSSTCSTMGDFVCDTDPVRNLLLAGNIADNVTNPCTDNPYNGAQKNIMGYGSGLNRFTQGQSDRALAGLLVARSKLMSSQGSVAPPAQLILPSTAPTQNNNNGNYRGIGPRNVTLNNLVYRSNGYNSSNNDYFIDNTCNLGATLTYGNSYTLEVTTGGIYAQRCKVWIDFNDDGILNVNELIGSSTGSSGTYTHTFNIPSSMLGGSVVYNKVLRMRIAADWSYSPDFTPTQALAYGQTEDFFVYIEKSLPVVFQNVEAKMVNNLLSVNWSTTKEKDNDYFAIEVSKDGKEFKELAKVKSLAENGISDAPLLYTYDKNLNNSAGIFGGVIFVLLLFSLAFYKKNRWLVYTALAINLGFLGITGCQKKDVVDKSAINENLYLRIKQVDKLGNAEYSKVVRVVKE